MALQAPTEGDIIMLQKILGASVAENLTLKLFTNNITPAKADTSATYTEATGNGYAAKTLSSGSWTTTTSTATYAQQTFNFTGAGSYFGYYIVGATSGKVYWSEAFGSAFTFGSGGGSIALTPTITLN